MFIAEFLFVFVLALLFTAFFGFAAGRYVPWPGLLWLFVILLLTAWALSVWFRPIGFPIRGVYWPSFVGAIFVVIVVVSLLLMAAASAARRPRKKTREELKGFEIRPLTPAEEQVEKERAQERVAASLGFLFWVLTAVALAALVVHYALS
jgi:hypothetical protein